MRKQLKPCPFCGGKAKIEKNLYEPDDMKGGVYCTKCQASLSKFDINYQVEEMDRDEAIKQWNTRK